MKAVNKFASIRNYLIGYYIVEYEQKGLDRAKYDEKLLKVHGCYYLVKKEFSKVELLCCFGEMSMTNLAYMGTKRVVRGSDCVCLCVTGSIFRLVFLKKYDQLNENGQWLR